MIPTQSLRSVLPLVIGLAVGGMAVGLFQQSKPGMAGSPEAQIQQLESELQQARIRIAALEETRPRSSRSPAQTAYDRGREIAQRLREGSRSVPTISSALPNPCSAICHRCSSASQNRSSSSKPTASSAN